MVAAMKGFNGQQGTELALALKSYGHPIDLPARSALVVGGAGREWSTVRHVRNGVGLDDLIAGRVDPDLPGIAVNHHSSRWHPRQSVHVGPLLDDLAGVRWNHGRVGAAMPDRHARPGSVMARRASHQIAPRARRTRRTLKHGLECLLDIGRRAIGQTGNDRATGKDLRIGREHDGGHRATG
jgi:hypothetical protein